MQDIILRSLFLNAETMADTETQYQLILGVIDQLQSGETVDEDTFALLTENVIKGRSVSVRKARRLLEQTGAFVFTDGCWQYNSALTPGGEALDWEHFSAMFKPKKTKSPSLSQGAEPVREAVLRGMRWSIEMTLLALRSREIDGQPAFYVCTEDGDQPIGYKVAGTATSDSLTMLCQASDYLQECGKSAEEIRECLLFLLDKTLACQCETPGWDQGGFFPLEDQPDSAHPTVDATCLAIMALCEFYEKRAVIEKALSITLPEEHERIENSVLQGLSFLFRMQREDGSFGIYCFENGSAAEANENCTRMVQSTMGVCKGSGIFDSIGREDLYPVCSKVIARTYTCLRSRMAEAGEYNVWAPFFGRKAKDYSAADVAVSTARVCRSLIPVWWQMEEEREKILLFCRHMLDYWRENETEVDGKIGRYTFNTPGETTFSPGEYAWSSHPDMLAAFSALQAYNLFGIALTKEHWAMIERAVTHTLNLQHAHGHWDNPLAEGTPFCAVTLAALELLQEYRIAKDYSK